MVMFSKRVRSGEKFQIRLEYEKATDPT